MGSKGSTRVESVDPFEVARADATFNRIDQFTPFGNLTFSNNPEGGFNNVANLQLNPFVADLANRQILSDQMLSDAALSRLQGFNQGSLPQLTSGLNTQGLPGLHGFNPAISGGQSFIGGQGFGFDSPIDPPDIPNFTGQGPSQGGSKGSKGGTQSSGSFSTAGDMLGSARQQLGGRIPGGPQDFAQKPTEGVLGATPDQTAGGGELRVADSRQRGDDGGLGRAFGMQSGPTAGPVPVLTALPGPPGPTTNPFGNLSQQGLPDARNQLSITDPNQSIGGDFEGARSGVEQAVFDRTASLLQPQFDQEQQRAIANFQRNKDDTFSRLADQAVISGGQEQSRLFGLDERSGLFGLGAEQQAFGQGLQSTDQLNNIRAQLFGERGAIANNQLQSQAQNFGQNLAGADFTRNNLLSLFDAANQSRQTGMQDIAFANQINQQARNAELQAQLQQANLTQANRATQFNELASLLGLQQVAQPGLNNFFTPGQTDVTGAFGLSNQANIANARNASAQKGGVMSALGGLGGAALGNTSGGVKGALGL
jgi:hypothetical protein